MPPYIMPSSLPLLPRVDTGVAASLSPPAVIAFATSLPPPSPSPFYHRRHCSSHGPLPLPRLLYSSFRRLLSSLRCCRSSRSGHEFCTPPPPPPFPPAHHAFSSSQRAFREHQIRRLWALGSLNPAMEGLWEATVGVLPGSSSPNAISASAMSPRRPSPPLLLTAVPSTADVASSAPVVSAPCHTRMSSKAQRLNHQFSRTDSFNDFAATPELDIEIILSLSMPDGARNYFGMI